MRSFKKYNFFLLFALLACSSADSKRNNHLPPKMNTEHLKSVLMDYRAEYHIPALAIGIFTPDTIMIAVAGIKDVISKRKVEVADRFHIGSGTKALTAFMAARLIEKRFLTWESKIADIFPEWDQETLSCYKNKTMADLLSHRAGIQPFVAGFEFKGRELNKLNKYSDLTLKNQYLKKLKCPG